MANIKTYQIIINGLKESITDVDALNKSLDNLESRIRDLQTKEVKIKTSVVSSSTGKERTSALSEEDKIQRQIAQTEEKRKAHQKDIYQSLLAEKDLLKEVDKDQKSIAASERLKANTYSNTITGMKQELSDLKQAMQTIDLSDDKGLEKMVQRANELNNRLKEIEASYGQFGRNVGNYSSAFNGIEKLSVNVGGVTREFNNAREASRTLKNELIGLEAAGSGNTDVANELRSAYYNLQSAMDDATKSSKAMDEAMDYAQSFTALASVGNGLKAFFGFDDSEVQKSIQRLVSLQGVLQGLESLRKQMETSEGIGQILTKGSSGIDKMVASLTGAKIATNGLTMGSKAATVAVRGLSMALKGVGIGLALEAINLLVQGIEWLSGKITNWVKGDADLIKEEKLLDAELDRVNKTIDERNEKLKVNYYQGLITSEQLYRGELKQTTDAINEQIIALKEKASLEDKNLGGNINNGITGEVDLSFGAGNASVKNLEELTTLWKHYRDAVLDGKDAMSKLNDETGSIDAWFRSFIYTLDDTKDDLVEIGQIAVGEFLKKYEHAMNTMQTDTKAGEMELAELKKAMNDNEMLRSIFLNLDQFIPVESVRKRIQNIINSINGLKVTMDDFEQRTVQQVLRSEQLKIDAMAEGAAKRQAQRDLDKKKELADATLTAKDKENIEKKYQQRKIKEEKQAGEKTRREAKKNSRELLEIEKDLSNLRIANMKEGLNKVLKQLEEERKQRLAKVQSDGKLIAERQAEINKLYDKKILDAKKDWADKVRDTYHSLWDDIYNMSLQTQQKIVNIGISSTEAMRENLNKERGSFSNQNIASYGIQGKNSLGSSSSDIGVISNAKSVTFGNGISATKEEIEVMKEYVEGLRQAQIAQNLFETAKVKYNNKLTKLTEEELKLYEDASQRFKEKVDERKEYLKQELGEAKFNKLQEALIEEGYSKELSTIFKQRWGVIETYWAERIAEEKKAAEANYNAQIQLENETYNKERRDNAEHQNTMLKQREKALKDGLITQEQFDELTERELTEHSNREKALTEEHSQRLKQLEIDKNNQLKQIVSESYSERLQELRDFLTAVSNLENKQPVFNSWGIIDIKRTRDNNKNLLDSYKTLATQILAIKKALQTELNENKISFDDFQQARRELDSFLEELGFKMDAVGQELKRGSEIGQFIQGINQYVQAGLNAINQVMQAINDYQDYQMNKLQDALEKENEMLQDKLDKQEEIINEHKSNVDSIEDELATSRGDRRQHLIDQLNNEMEAQRNAYKEQQRLEKLKKANEKKQEQLEKKRKKAEYQRNLTSILISTAMATANGLATQPFIPVGIAMGALATSLGMVQYALAAKQKPYARGGQLDGGVAVGNRHRDGGIKVLGGRAEIEGGEYVTNRISTQMNHNLLDYINSKKKRIDLNDLVEFYSGGKVKKSVLSMQPKVKYADGGQLPSITRTNEINDRLIESFERYAQRPSVVQVVDIVNKTDNLKKVQVLAGLSS